MPSSPTKTVLPTPVTAERIKTLSGANWCASFPGSNSADDLREPFKQNFYEFFAAMEEAGCAMTIAATYRPEERAYMMHFCWEIAKNGLSPSKVPPHPNVDIEWDHLDADKSKKAAEDMCTTFGLNHLKISPDLDTRHTRGFAIDMNITWDGDLNIRRKDGSEKEITTTPRDRMNKELHEIGAGYGIIKFSSPPSADKPHWSIDGH